MGTDKTCNSTEMCVWRVTFFYFPQLLLAHRVIVWRYINVWYLQRAQWNEEGEYNNDMCVCVEVYDQP